MSFLSEIPLIGGFLSGALFFMVLVAIVIFIHEMGHYLVGRWCGIQADAFSIGFGKEIWGWTDSRGTRWRLAPIPLGGYVKFRGDSNPASAGADAAAIEGMSAEEREGCFHTAALWRRVLTVAAGPVANFLLAIVVFGALALSTGVLSRDAVVGSVPIPARTGADFEIGDRILEINGERVATMREAAARASAVPGGEITALILRGGREMSLVTQHLNPVHVSAVIEDSAALDAGIEAGDLIIRANGLDMHRFTDLQAVVNELGATPIALVVMRGDERIEMTLTPRLSVTQDPDSDGIIEKPLIGIRSSSRIQPPILQVGVIGAMEIGVERTVGVMVNTYYTVRSIILGAVSANQLSGPIGIAEASGKAAEGGALNFFGFLAFVSVSIGLINLFPIPVLDGGHLLFYAVEAVRGRPMGARAIEISTGLGLGLVLLLMVFATYNDLGRLLSLG